MKLSFNINKVTTGPDEKLFVVGNLSGLGSWKIIDALEMQKIDELAWQSIDYITFEADDTQYLEYKYVKQSNLMDAIWENGDNRKFDLSVYREKQSDPLCVVNIEDKEFDNQAFKVPSSRAIRLGDVEVTETVNSNYNGESSILLDIGSLGSGDDQNSCRTEEEQLVKMEEKLYMAKLGLHAMTQRLKKKDDDLEIFKQQLSLRQGESTHGNHTE